MQGADDIYVTYGFGYVKLNCACFGLIQEDEIFVPQNDAIKINLIRFKNTLSEKRNIKILYYLKPVIGEDETKTNGYIDLKLDREKNILYARSIYGDNLLKNVYISSSEEIKSYTGNNLSFIGTFGSIQNPEAINKDSLNFQNGLRSSIMYSNRDGI